MNLELNSTIKKPYLLSLISTPQDKIDDHRSRGDTAELQLINETDISIHQP